MLFTTEQVAQLAPDAASLKSGKDLARASKWLSLGDSGRAIWGELQGSGKDPYRTTVDTQSTAFKCSCPSRKFPCKHGLGLLFVLIQSEANVPKGATEPAWVQEWMDKRQEKAEKTANPSPENEPDEKTIEQRARDKAKRAAARAESTQAAAAEMETFLKDLLRGGFLALPTKNAATFGTLAARMVDNKAPGLATFARNFQKINYFQGNGWHSEALENAAQAWLLLDALRHRDVLPSLVQQDLNNLLWPQKREELFADPAAETIEDEWLVLAKTVETEDDLRTHKHWLWGCKTGRSALILDFSYKSAPIQTLLVPGMAIEATLVFYPSNWPFRAVVKTQGKDQTEAQTKPIALENWSLAQREQAENLARYPWIDDWPQFVSGISLATEQQQWFLQDQEHDVLPLNPDFKENQIWHFLALTGGQPSDLFVLRTGKTVLPIGFLEKGVYHIL